MGGQLGPLRTALEGVRTLGFEIFDLGRLHSLYGDHHRLLLGSYVLLGGILHPQVAPAALSPPSNCLSRPDLRRHPILRHSHVRPLLPQYPVLPTRALLLLVLLFLHEFHLDCDPWM